MKVWISQEKAQTHHLVRLNLEQHSDYSYIGDLDDNELKELFLKIKPDIDVEKNIQLLKYFGYLHLFVITKKESRTL